MGYSVILVLALGIFHITDGVKLWNSKVPRSNFIWRDTWKKDDSTYIGKQAVSADPNPNGELLKVIGISHKQGSYGLTTPDSGAEFYAAPLEPRNCLTLSYMVRFEDNFDFAYGGKLPGLYGGGANCTAGTDPGKDCFTSRFIWRPEGFAGGAVFTSTAQQSDAFCSASAECNDVWGHRLQSNFRFETGIWYNMVMTVRVNTLGQKDGFVRLAVTGPGKIFRTTKIQLRTSDIKVNGIFVSNFFGGSNSCSASPVDTKIHFKTFVLKDAMC